jgi:hypothetical protein
MAKTNLAVVEPREMKVIPNADLDRVKELQEETQKLSAKLKALCKELDPLEKSCIERLESGWRCPMGRQAAIETSQRVAPKWKEHFLLIVGEQEAAKIIAETEPSITKHLVVSNYGPEYK